ncbi:MAG: endonuclease MutS2 [Acidobacteriota bacterium]
MAVTHNSLEFDDLKGVISEFADSALGRRFLLESRPTKSKTLLEKELRKTQEALETVTAGRDLRLRELQDLSALFEMVSLEGSVVTPEECRDLLNFCRCARSTKSALVGGMQGHSPELESLGQEIPNVGSLISSLETKVDDSGAIQDHASPTLKRIRGEIAALRTRIYNSLERVLERHKHSQVVQDEVITIRNERYVLPVRADSRKAFAGVVHAASSSGATLFIEPFECLELNNHLVGLHYKAEEEIRRILRELSDAIRTQLEPLRRALNLLAELDSLFAKARFAVKHEAVIPAINEDGVLSLVDARHPLLDKRLREAGSSVVPISIEMSRSSHVLVISGANTGGKTVALKTIGLLALMALSAFPVTASSANVCLFREVYADIGDRQSIGEDLSTFSSHLVNIQSILESATAPALVLLDELGTGTDPSEGAALGVAIVERFRENEISLVATTHHNALKAYASRTPRTANASVEFDEERLRPTYRLLHGVPGNSSGIEIARRLGLDEGLIRAASERLSREEQDLVRFSAELRDESARAAQLRLILEQERKAVEALKQQVDKHYRALQESRIRELEEAFKRTIARFDEEGRKLLSEVKDKYAAVRVRRELERKAAKLRASLREQELTVASDPLRKQTAEEAAEVGRPAPLKIGMRVWVPHFRRQGVVTESNKDGSIEVLVGNLKCNLSPSEVEVAAAGEPPGAPQPVKSQISVRLNGPELTGNELNVVGCTVDEAIGQVDKFLDRAYLAAISPVRLVHGSGMGVLRKAIAKWLAQQPSVERFHPADATEGGSGVTVVSLKV